MEQADLIFDSTAAAIYVNIAIYKPLLNFACNASSVACVFLNFSTFSTCITIQKCTVYNKKCFVSLDNVMDLTDQLKKLICLAGCVVKKYAADIQNLILICH